MKKTILLIVLSFVMTFSFGQTYKFDRVFMSPNFLKMSGSVSISDTTLILNQNGIVSNIPVKILNKLTINDNNTSQYISSNNQSDIRFTFSNNPTPNKNEKYIMVMEVKDKFTNMITNIMYYLKDIN